MTVKRDVLAATDSASLRAVTARKILLAGEAVFASLQPAVPDGFTQQTPRDAVAGIFAQFAKSAPKVFVSVDDRVFDVPKVRFALAIEGYLAWGLRECKRGTTVLFGGAETAQSTSVTIIVFSDSRVVELDEKVLPETSASYFRDALTSMIAELRMKYPTARMVQADPLESWDIPEVAHVGDAPLRGLSYRPLRKNHRRRMAYAVPATIVGLGALFYIGALTTGWNRYQQATDDYELAIADPEIRARGGIDTNFLDVMTARRVYMEQPRRQAVLADKTEFVARGIGGVPNVQILEMRLPAPSITLQQQPGITVSPEQAKQRNIITPERSPDVWLAISVPKTNDAALNQAQQVMTMIANNTGMSLRLAHQGWRDDKNRRVFNIEGFIHD